MKIKRIMGIGAAAMMAAAGLSMGTAGTASASNGGCRGLTDPGTYPSSIQLQACMNADGTWFAGVTTPDTDVQAWYQVMDRSAWQSGEPTYAVTPPTVLGTVGWGAFPFSGSVPIATSHCYYLRVWFVDGSTTYGYTESPGACV
ncbi:hypothetical protein GCM10010339_91210 [Streptomyces alanosinicus]|uniref:Secreted protein n=2 Tax=Streptomyces alanosinicus TaxID=68171 RepID=A0A918YU53_9ACTN|nr:hypothetical protein GCM10010339_91210 [Streptomyces alanosinicus]